MTEATKCPKCGTMLREAGLEVGSTYAQHVPARCRDVLHAQLTAERTKVEEATKALESVASCDENVCECPSIAESALEKLRGQ